MGTLAKRKINPYEEEQNNVLATTLLNQNRIEPYTVDSIGGFINIDKHIPDWQSNINKQMPTSLKFITFGEPKDIKPSGVRSMEYENRYFEKYIDTLKDDIKEIKESLNATEERIGLIVDRAVTAMNQSVNQTLDEIRTKDSQRHSELLALNERIDKANSDVMNKLDSTNKWIIGLIITAIIGIVGIGVTVILFFCQITTTYF